MWHLGISAIGWYEEMLAISMFYPSGMHGRSMNYCTACKYSWTESRQYGNCLVRRSITLCILLLFSHNVMHLTSLFPSRNVGRCLLLCQIIGPSSSVMPTLNGSSSSAFEGFGQGGWIIPSCLVRRINMCSPMICMHVYLEECSIEFGSRL